MENFYFTFGTDERFPYDIGDYVLVKGTDGNDAAHKFSKKYPKRGNGNVNCAGIYTEDEFFKIKEKGYYKGVSPVDVIE